MTKRKLFIPVIAVSLIGILLGSIFDLQIDQALYSSRNVFAIFLTSISAFVGYAGLVISGSYIFFYSNKNFKKFWIKFLSVFAAAACVCFFSYATYGDFIDKHGWSFSIPLIKYIVGAALVLLTLSCFIYLGYYFTKQNNSLEAFIVAFSICFITMFSFGCAYLIKLFVVRPRFRWLVSLGLEDIEFCNWWQMNKDKDILMSLYNATSGDLKSFPSGHGMNSACAMITLGYLPLIDNRLMKRQTLLFFIGFAFNLIVCFSRLILGAHFLSDVCFGSLITTLVFYIYNEIYIHYAQKVADKIKEYS